MISSMELSTPTSPNEDRAQLPAAVVTQRRPRPAPVGTGNAGIFVTGIVAVVVTVGSFFASQALSQISGAALWVPAQYRMGLNILSAGLGVAVFALAVVVLHFFNPPQPEKKQYLRGKTILALSAGVLAVVLSLVALGVYAWLRSECVIGFDPTTWYGAEQKKLALAKQEHRVDAGATVHVPEFVDLANHRIYLPLKYPAELQKDLAILGDPPGGPMNDLLQNDPDTLFDDVEKSRSPEPAKTAALFMSLDAVMIMLAAFAVATGCNSFIPVLTTPTMVGSCKLAPAHTAAFISYRRADGSDIARLVRAELQERGITTFLDVDDLGSYYFDDRLFNEIDKLPNFILILTPQAVAGMNEPNDWVRKEIAHACRKNRNIIPVVKEGFVFPAANQLPPELVNLPRYNSVIYSHAYFNAAMDKLEAFLQNPQKANPASAATVSQPQQQSPDEE
jgi:hypothetical protein